MHSSEVDAGELQGEYNEEGDEDSNEGGDVEHNLSDKKEKSSSKHTGDPRNSVDSVAKRRHMNHSITLLTLVAPRSTYHRDV